MRAGTSRTTIPMYSSSETTAGVPDATSAYVSLSQVGKTYASSRGPVPALLDINLDIRPREFVSVVGPSGCGKSTLLKLVAGLEGVSAGSVCVAGRPLDGPPDGLGVVFQRDVLLDWRTILDNVLLSIEFTAQADAGRARSRDGAVEALRSFRIRGSFSVGTLGRHAPARLDLPGAAGRPRIAADGRAVRRARCDDAGRPQCRACANLAGHPKNAAVHYPFDCRKRCFCRTAW